ncbi:CvpA family protein [Pseudoruminococcus massiliensis]|uniref:CvpA family protein n=1 Tax=Pseudoruminococcus massiliensis TaxID=2086583 RepID=UPI0022E204BD|nr:CvpA family protein [Pseudoruminococcus massiliensis]
MDMLSVALDITTVVIIILITATSIKRGLITSIIEFVGGILSAVVSAFLGWFFAIAGYNISFKSAIMNSVDSVIYKDGGFISENIFNALPKMVQNSLGFDGINSSNFLNSSTVNNSNTITEAIEQQVSPYVISYMTKISMVVFFTIFMVIIITLSSKFSKYFANNDLKIFNNIFSALFGLVKAIFIIMTLIILVDAIVLSLDADSYNAFNNAVNSSILFKLIYNVNIPSFIISIITGA